MRIRVFSVIFFLLAGVVWGQGTNYVKEPGSGGDGWNWGDTIGWNPDTGYPGQNPADTATINVAFAGASSLSLGSASATLPQNFVFDTLTIGNVTVNLNFTNWQTTPLNTLTLTTLTLNGNLNVGSVADTTNSNPETSAGTINITNLIVGANGQINFESNVLQKDNAGNDLAAQNGGAFTGLLLMDGAIVTVSTTTDIVITAVSDVSIGAIDAPNRTVTITSSGGDININGDITAQNVFIEGDTSGTITINSNINAGRLVINAHYSDVIVGAAGAITVTSNGTEGISNAAMYVSANKFTATAGAADSINIPNGELCLNAAEVDIGAGIVANDAYHDHLTPYEIHGHLVYSPTDPAASSVTIPSPYTWIDSSGIGLTQTETYTVDPDHNIYIIDVDTTSENRQLTFEVSGTGFIEVTGNYITSATGSVAFNLTGTGGIILNDAGISLGAGSFNTNGTALALTGTNSITAANITLNEVSGTGSLALTANAGNVTFSGSVTAGSLEATANAGNITFSGTVNVTGNLQVVSSILTYINANITTTGAQTYSSNVTIGGTGTRTLISGGNQTFAETVALNVNTVFQGAGAASNVIFSESVNGVAYSLTVTNANVQFDGAVSLASLSVSGTTALNADITTTGNQSYGGNVTLGGTGAERILNSGGSIETTGAAIFTAGTVTEINVFAGSFISLPNSNNVPVVNLSSTGTTAGNITYNSSIGSGNNLTVTASGGAASGGSVSITEVTGNIIVGTSGIQTTQGAAVNLTASNGSVTIGGGIGSGASRAGVVTITSGANQSITIGAAIYSFSLKLLADINNGTVAINAGIDVSSSVGDVHDDTSAVYVTTGTFSGNGAINLTQTSAWVCVWVSDNVSYSINNVTGERIHFHLGKNIVYSTGTDPGNLIGTPYLYLDAEDAALGTSINFSITGSGNVYIINIPLGSANGANTRDVNFSTEDGFIEFRGSYVSSGQLNISPNGASGNGVRLDGAQITLTGVSFDIAGTNKNINVVNGSSITAPAILIDGDVSGTSSLELTASSGNVTVNGTINGITDMEMTAALGNIIINGSLGNTNRLNSVSLAGNIQLNASDIYTGNDITLTGNVAVTGTVDIDTSAGNIEFSSVINGTTGVDTLRLTASGGNIQLNNIGTAASRLLGNISIISGNVDILSGAVFFMPAAGGTVSFGAGVSVSSGTLILNGGSLTTPVNLDAASTGITFGDVSIAANSNVTVTANSTITQTGGSTLTIGNSAVLDITAASSSWSIGAAATGFNFTGNNGFLALDTNARIVAHNLNFNNNSFAVNNGGVAYITVTGNADISAADIEGGGINYQYLVFEMNGAGMQTLYAARSLSRLHVKTNSLTTLTNDLQIDGEVVIEYPGVLAAGSHNVTLSAILDDTKQDLSVSTTSFSVKVGRWQIINGPEDVSGGGTSHNMFAFTQSTGGIVEFKKHSADASGNPVFFEIIGNTVWQTFYCEEPGVTFQFSTHEVASVASLHQHVFLHGFEVQVPDAAATSTNYITLTRLPQSGGLYNFYSPGETTTSVYKPPNSTFTGAAENSSLPTVPVSSNLKADNNFAELSKFWNFNLVGDGTGDPLQIKHVAIFFSHAWYQRVPIASTQMDLKAIPFYRTVDNRGHFNYDWVEVRRIIYSYAEDGNGNGKVDRIRVQSNVNLNGHFDNFDVAVEGFQVNRKEGDNGFSVVQASTGDNDDLSSFYIYLEEAAELYDGKSLKWWVTQNDSLFDSISQQLPVGDPADDEQYYTINTIPPRISYTLSLPGHDETYIRFSQPVSLYDSITKTYKNGSVFKSGRVTGIVDERTSPRASYEHVLEYYQDIRDDIQYKLKDDMVPPANGAISYLAKLDDKPDVTDLADIPEIGVSILDWYFELDDLRDMGVRALDWNDMLVDEDMFMYYPSPRYPIDWNYSSYATYTGNSHVQEPDGGGDLTPDSASNITNLFLPPNRVLTPEMVRRLATGGSVTPDQFAGDDNRRRITDVLISRPPEKAADDNYFAWPVWAMQDAADTSIVNNPLFDDFVFSDPYVELSDILKSDNNIIWNFDGSRNLDMSTGYEMQVRINNNLSGNLDLFYSLNVPAEYRNPVGNSPSGRIMGSLWLPVTTPQLYYFVPWMNPNFTDLPPSSAANSLFNFNISGTNASGQRLEFLFKFSSNVNLYIARLEAPAGTVPQNWYELVRPFGFDIQDIIRQRGGVTILNNVINSNNREVTYLRYNLARAGRVTIQVYTLDGTLVKSLRRNEHRDAGEWTDGWDGTNNGGRPVARGMYFIRIVAPDIDEIRKVMVVR